MDIWGVPVFKTGSEPDKQGDTISPYCEVLFDKTVCLVRDFNRNLGKAIGTAQLRKDGDTVFADLYIIHDHDWHELMYPSIGGKVLKSIVDIKTGKKTITEMKIDVVSLGVGRNADPRIKNLKDY